MCVCVQCWWAACVHAPPLARTTPQSLACLQSHAGAAEDSGSLGARHTLCTAGPHQPRPEGTTLKDMENWGRELPSCTLLGQAELERGNVFKLSLTMMLFLKRGKQMTKTF